MAAGQSLASVVLPLGAPASTLRFLVPSLDTGVAYVVRAAPAPPPLPGSVAALLTRPVPLTFTVLGDGSGECDGGEATVTSPTVPAAPVIGKEGTPSGGQGLSCDDGMRVAHMRADSGRGGGHRTVWARALAHASMLCLARTSPLSMSWP